MSSPHATLGQTVADALRETVLSGGFALGERIVELAIAQKYQVSQAAVRDALHLLEREGWVVWEARRGVRVRGFTPDSAHEVFALMAEIEGLALGWALRDHTRVAVLEAVRPSLLHARRAHDLAEWDARRTALMHLHHHIARLAARPQTNSLLSGLSNQAHLLAAHHDRHGNPDPYRAAQIEGYEHWYGVLKFGTPDEAQAALRARIHADGTPIVRWLAAH
ncbi:MAG: GntR family transcriptional regulator [Anaerolineae bacterium]|jgi:DNA-binding GntR family transcriptional regulator|nr:GntR family transcriptional regulator [Anaerolineae bacterium]